MQFLEKFFQLDFFLKNYLHKENGEFKYPVNEITIAGNFNEMFKNITLANDLEFKYSVNSPTQKEYTIARQKVEFALESFYRSASSLVFQLNKRHITRHMSIFRCIDKRFETGEIFIKWDESSDEEWLLLIYIKNNSPDDGIVIEDKTNPEKNMSHEFKNNEIFKASDTMVDSLTQLIARKRAKNNN